MLGACGYTLQVICGQLAWPPASRSDHEAHVGLSPPALDPLQLILKNTLGSR